MSSSQSIISSSSTGFSTPTTNAPTEMVEEPQASKIFRIVFFSLTTLASFVGNSVMLKAAYRFPSRKPLSYHLVTNLAAAEIINTLCLPFSFVYLYLEHWPFGEFACKLTTPLQVLSLFVVTNSLTAIAVYRFAFIVFQVRITVTYRKLFLLFSLLWLIAFAVSMPLSVYGQVVSDDGNNLCLSYFKGRPSYNIIRFILNFGLPYLIMVVSYAAVALKLKRHIGRSTREAAEMTELGESTKQTQGEEEPTQHQDTEATERERKKCSRAIEHLEKDLLKMIYLIIITFAVCYLPYQVQFLFRVFGGFDHYPEIDRYSSIIQEYCLLLTCLSSALHPLCYGTMSKFYARSFSRLVLCRCKSAE